MARDLEGVALDIRMMGLRIGDTIQGREKGPGGYWHEARLTLLWFGQKEAVWSVQTRSNMRPQWSEPEEDANWCLDARKWKKVAPAREGEAG